MVSIWVNAESLEPADAFPYHVRTIEYNNSNWEAVYHNLRKDNRRWGVISKLLTKTVAMVRACSMPYKLMTQTLILYESES